MTETPKKYTFTVDSYREFPALDPNRRGEKDVFLVLRIGERDVIPVRVEKEKLTEDYLKGIVKDYIAEKAKWEGKKIDVELGE